MAQRILTLLLCDLHEDETEGDETITFSFDGTGYEIDTCKEHADELRETLAVFTGHARKLGRGGVPQQTKRASSPRRTASASTVATPVATPAGVDVTAVREWARENGHTVSERGRLSAKVLEAYTAAH